MHFWSVVLLDAIRNHSLVSSWLNSNDCPPLSAIQSLGGGGQNLGNGWSKSIVPENKVAINFDFRSGAKKSGHLDYPLQSYGPKFVNICKYFDSVALAHHPMQYLGELLFFHTPLYIRGVWKNINSPKYYIGWCARATEQSFNFFRK